MKPFSAISVDDEPGAHHVLASLLHSVAEIELVEHFTSPVVAREALASLHCELLFLDVSMPGLSGLELLRSLPTPPVTVLLTAHVEYAIESFELGVRDYLLKPVSPARLQVCLENIRPLLCAAREMPGATLPERLAIKTGLERKLIDPREITHIEADGNFCIVHAVGKRIYASQSMKELDSHLGAFGFLRVHKSWLVNVRHVRYVAHNAVGVGEGITVPIGRAYRPAVSKELQR